MRSLPVPAPLLPVLRLLVLLGLALSAGSGHAAEALTLRLGTLLPSGTAQHTELQGMIEQWRKASAGTVKVILYPDGRLGGESEMVKKLRIKQLNAALFTAVGLAELDPGVAGLQLMPLMFRTWEEVDYVREKLRPLLEERLRAKGYEVLFWADAGWVRFFSKEAAIRPADFRRMKIFSWAGDVRQSDIMKSIGYRPIGLETTDIVMGLNTDMINVVPVPPLVALAGQLYGPAPHMLDLNWCPIVGAAVVRSDAWQKLAPALQQEFLAAATATGVKLRTISRREGEESVKAMQARGLQVHPLTPEAAEEWRQLAESVQPKVRGSLVPADIFDAVLRHLAEYRQTAASR